MEDLQAYGSAKTIENETGNVNNQEEVGVILMDTRLRPASTGRYGGGIGKGAGDLDGIGRSCSAVFRPCCRDWSCARVRETWRDPSKSRVC